MKEIFPEPPLIAYRRDRNLADIIVHGKLNKITKKEPTTAATKHRIINNQDFKSGQEGLDCPSCRKKHQVSKEQLTNLPKNLALENIVFRFQEIQSASLSQFKSNSLSLNSSLGSQSSDRDSPVFAEDVNELCGLCDGKSPNKATWFCEQCSVLYCERCLEKFHPRRGTLCHHRIRKPSHMEGESKPAFCEDHTTEQATVFYWINVKS
ncbi:unnamed protein product [Mytilus edulis]|uniref:B box-type domain-containing protein n=1 Tax=Mytilus edulis TaxID=6550 RepID=A0A8S3Q2S1_MYTED|nr:unnamed protein product [Mytilus edulis]